MRQIIPAELERNRIKGDPSWGFYGAFAIPTMPGLMRIIAAGGDSGDVMAQGWEHVSVSFADRCPTWDEMCRVKEMFWTDEEAVLQFHPAKTDYVNVHPFVLHLWKPPYPIILPPRDLV